MAVRLLSAIRVTRARTLKNRCARGVPISAMLSQYTGPAPTEPVAGSFRDPRLVILDEMRLLKSKETGEQVIPRETDIVIIGGGLVGLATAFWLKQWNPDGYSVTLIERDPTYSQSSSVSSVGGLRQQFSLPENVQMSLLTATFLRDLADHLQILDLEVPDINFNPQGCLLLAADNGIADMENDFETQIKLGVNVDLMTQQNLKDKFPWMTVDDIALGSYGLEKEGWFNQPLLVAALKAKAASLGCKFITGEVVGFGTTSSVVPSAAGTYQERRQLLHVHVKSRPDDSRVFPIQFSSCFNCAGPWSREIARLAGIGTGRSDALVFDLPIVPRRRYVFVFKSLSGPGFDMPMLYDLSGLYVRREGIGGFFVCSALPTEEVEQKIGDSIDAMNDYFKSDVQPKLIHRIPAFENVQLITSWVNVYDYNYFDRAPFVGNHPYHRNFIMATGLCGLGAQHGPAIGRALMEMFIYDEYRTVDLSRFSFDRILDDDQLVERLFL